MSQLLDLIQKSLGDNGLNAISQQLGESPEQTKAAVDQALPLMIGALSSQKNAGSGWSLLSSFLDQNHDGSVMDDLMRLATGGNQTQNASALSQILGASQPAVQQHLGQTSGLSQGSIQKLMVMLAPMIIGALAKTQATQKLDQNSLTQMLQTERSQIQARSPQTASFLTSILDSDKDGSVVDDLAAMGGKALGKLFGK